MPSLPAARKFVLLAIAVVGMCGGCSGFDLINAPVSSCGYFRSTSIAYGVQPRQQLDIYRPRHAAAGARVVIFFYGGYWAYGEKRDYRFAAQALTSAGFIAVLPDYRRYPNVKFPAFVDDGALAIRWVHDHIAEYGGDPKHLYLMGHSAGAHIVALLALDGHYLKNVGLDRSDLRAAVGISGPYDFQPTGFERQIFNMKPGQAKPDPAIEPVTFASGKAPPMLLMQGLADNIVNPINAFELAARIRMAGGDAQVIAYPTLGHRGTVLALAWEFRWLAPVLRDAAEFMREH